MIELMHGKAKIWVKDITKVESSALDQVKAVASLPFIFKHIAGMADIHYGKGSTVGSVIVSKGAVIPASVGVDIFCGMLACPLNIPASVLRECQEKIFYALSEAIPVGFTLHKKAVCDFSSFKKTASGRVQKFGGRAELQLGTLGGGNHFLEVCEDQDGNAWIMLHSGSRNVGKELAECHIAIAKRYRKDHRLIVPNEDLSYLTEGTVEFSDYLEDVAWCGHYAKENRRWMLMLAIKAINSIVPIIKDGVHTGVINCHHNYFTKETHFGEEVIVTRKGAIRAGVGEWGIIPGAMGVRSYIVVGKGNPESFESASHGAGRARSRSASKKLFSQKDVLEQTEGLTCRKDMGIADELPGAYKNIDEVMAAQEDLVEIKHTLKAFICLKG